MTRPGAVVPLVASLTLISVLVACSGDIGAVSGVRATSEAFTDPPDAVVASPEVSVAPAAPTVAWAPTRLDDEAPVEVAVPVRIEIAAIGVEAPILALGVVLETGEMEVPENIDEVGWYRHGPAPGRPGSAVLAAHVDMAGEGPGVFFDLDRLSEGDQIKVDFADGTASSFVVTRSERVPKELLDVDSLFAPDGQSILRLVTCGGGFNRTIGSYDDNIVVTAQLATG